MTTDQINWPTLEEWADALESGEYPQGRGQLNGKGYCCLGVYADLCVKRGIGGWQRSLGGGYDYIVHGVFYGVFYGRQLPTLFGPVCGIGHGFHPDLPLTQLNDGGTPFHEIAKLIRAKARADDQGRLVP